MDEQEHDPFNEPELAHPRARELMPEKELWDCADEEAPFGSDEGFEAYHEYRSWRSSHPQDSLVDCLNWIMSGRLDEYDETLLTDERIDADLAEPERAFLSDSYDVFTLDATVIASALGQLIDEGRIDEEAKPYLRVALGRQLHPRVLSSAHRRGILTMVERVINEA